MPAALKTTPTVRWETDHKFGLNASKRSGQSASLRSEQSSHLSKKQHASVATFTPVQLVPLWLRCLVVLQRSLSMATLILVAAMMALYGWSVYSQKNWNQMYQRLQTLRRHEQQLTVASEELKHQIAEQAEQPGLDFVVQKPTNTLFLRRTAQSTPPPSPPSSPQPPLTPDPSLPVAY